MKREAALLGEVDYAGSRLRAWVFVAARRELMILRIESGSGPKREVASGSVAWQTTMFHPCIAMM